MGAQMCGSMYASIAHANSDSMLRLHKHVMSADGAFANLDLVEVRDLDAEGAAVLC